MVRMKSILNSVTSLSQRILLSLLFCTSMIYAVFTEDLVLQIQTGTQVEMTGMATPQLGYTVYNTDDNKIYVYDGTSWVVTASDQQDITGSHLSGTTLTVGITNGNSDTVDLSALVNDADANVTNEIQTLSIVGQDISLSNGGGSVTIPSETSTNLSQDMSTGVITYTNEDVTNQTANVVSADVDNQVIAGSDGGAYVGPTVYNSFFIISSSGNKVVSGLPFQPSQVTFVTHANIESLNIDADNGTGNNDRGIDNSFGTMNGFARDDSGTITQQVIYAGGHGNSINDISRYASSSHCIGVRYGDQNGADLGKITASLSSFNPSGFTLNVTYINGTITVNSGNTLLNVQPTDILNESLVVLYTAYK